jgi:ketosteroid isomerase-like protein
VTRIGLSLGLLAGLCLAAALPRAGRPVNASPARGGSTPAPCAAPEYRQFDFWVGDWDVYEASGGDRVARVRVDRVLDACALREDYRGANGTHGQSFSVYDAPRKVWHQTWVTNRGQLLTIEGGPEGGQMTLAGSYRDAHGEETRVRGTWKPVAGGVRETAVTSGDGGKTWQPWFDLLFREGKAAPSEEEDRRTVAQLDTEYQAAVKRNDAAVMDRILADDFLLVTGSGKTHDKADLLRDARSGGTFYQHQEDSERTVRVWGDTAVVTAKLWEKGSSAGKSFDYTLWFSDTYVRTPSGWRYVFGQAAGPLAKAPEH